MKTKIFFINCLGAGLLLLNSSCLSDFNTVTGRGNLVTNTCFVDQFSDVELQSSANVEIVKGDVFDVQVSDYENIIDCIGLKVIGNKLIVRKEPNTVAVWNSKAHVRITMPDSLYSVRLSGSGTMKIGPSFNQLNYVTLSGSGNLIVSQLVNPNRLEAQLTGSGNLSVSGSVPYLVVRNSGSGDMKLSNLMSHDASCKLEGSGDVYVSIENKLDVFLSGSGDLVYNGNPVIHSYTSGSGHLYKAGH